MFRRRPLLCPTTGGTKDSLYPIPLCRDNATRTFSRYLIVYADNVRFKNFQGKVEFVFASLLIVTRLHSGVTHLASIVFLSPKQY